jgi:hypothetical protein
MSDLQTCYRYHREKGQPAAQAVQLARADVAAGKARYSDARVGYGSSGQPFAAFGERHMRWIESPRAAGLRFAGYCDQLASIGHTGWFLDDEFQDETVRVDFYRMPAHDGHARYVAGHDNPDNGSPEKDGPVCLSFDEMFEGDKRDSSWDGDSGAVEAARRADDIARRMTESEREYRRVSNAGLRYRDLGEEIADTRRKTLELIREIKARKATLCDGPAIVAALRADIADAIKSIRKARKAQKTLFDDYGREEGFADA